MNGSQARWARVRSAAADPSAGLLLAQSVVAAVAFGANLLCARALAPDGRGQLALLLQIGYLASLVMLLGTDRSVVAGYSGLPVALITRAYLRLVRLPIGVGLLLAVLAAGVPALLAGLTPAHATELWVLAGLTGLFAALNVLVRAVRSIAISAHGQRDYVFYTLTSQGLLLVAQIGLLRSGVHDVAWWVLVYLLAGASPMVVLLRSWLHGTDHPAHDVARLRAARREGLALFPSAVATSGMLRLDRLLLAAMASTAALGVYASIATITEALAWPMIIFADARLGRWRGAHDAHGLAVRPLVLRCAAFALVSGPVAVGVLQLGVEPLLGTAYRSARELVVPLVVAALVFGTEQVLASALIASRRSGLASVCEVSGFAVSVLAYLILIPRHGAAGAAWGSLVGYTAGLLVAAVALTRPGRAPAPLRRPVASRL